MYNISKLESKSGFISSHIMRYAFCTILHFLFLIVVKYIFNLIHLCHFPFQPLMSKMSGGGFCSQSCWWNSHPLFASTICFILKTIIYCPCNLSTVIFSACASRVTVKVEEIWMYIRWQQVPILNAHSVTINLLYWFWIYYICLDWTYVKEI